MSRNVARLPPDALTKVGTQSVCPTCPGCGAQPRESVSLTRVATGCLVSTESGKLAWCAAFMTDRGCTWSAQRFLEYGERHGLYADESGVLWCSRTCMEATLIEAALLEGDAP